MSRQGRLPFWTCLVFCIGLSGGFSLRSGWLPVEFGGVRTGQVQSEHKPASQPNPPPEQDPLLVASHVDLDETTPADEHVDTVVFERQTEPEEDTQASAQTIRQKPTESSSHSNETVLQAKYRQDEGDSEPTPPAQDSIQLELNSIDEQISDGEMLPAHRALSKLYWNHKDRRDEVIERLEKTSEKIFFQSQPHFIEPYVVQPNDQLRVIASKYNLSWEYLARLNNTEPRRIRSGQKLKVVKGPFAAAIDLADFTLTIHLQGYFVKAYQVGIGQNGSSPLGKFSVLNKVENPQYTGPDGKVISADDPTNPLGERWIDLGDSYGIHGTVDPDSIGKAASRGCIRMRDKDVIEVYNFLIKGSEVVIRE